MSRRKKLPPIHPGEILQEEFLAPLGLSQYRLAKDTSVPPRRINEIVRGDCLDHRRHRPATGPLLRYLGALLDESANPLRPRSRERPPRHATRTRSSRPDKAGAIAHHDFNVPHRPLSAAKRRQQIAAPASAPGTSSQTSPAERKPPPSVIPSPRPKFVSPYFILANIAPASSIE